MKKKVTLSIEDTVLLQAKSIFPGKISSLFEDFLKQITEKKLQTQKKKKKYSKRIQALSGIISTNDIKNIKDDYTDYLINKYS